MQIVYYHHNHLLFKTIFGNISDILWREISNKHKKLNKELRNYSYKIPSTYL